MRGVDAGALPDGIDGVETVGEGVGTVRVGSVGVETVGTDTVGTDTVGTDTVGTDTVGTDTVGTDTVGTDTVGTVVGTVSAGLECACRPRRSSARATTRIPQTAMLKASRAARVGRHLSRARDPLQPPRMASYRYPFLMISIHTQFASIRRSDEPRL